MPTLERRAEVNGCTGTPTMSQEYCQTCSGCAGGVEVTLRLLPATRHVAYKNWLGFDIRCDRLHASAPARIGLARDLAGAHVRHAGFRAYN